MTKTQRIALPHSLGKEEVKRRINSRIGELPGHLPGGLGNVAHSWPAEDRMTLTVNAMGQTVDCELLVEDAQVIVALALPPMLSFFSGAIEDGVQKIGARMLTDQSRG